MRILFLLPDFPYPPNNGGNSKIFSLIKILSKENKCDLLCFGNKNLYKINELNAISKNIRTLGIINRNQGVKNIILKIKNIFLGTPPSFSAYESKKFTIELKKILLIYEYDIVHLDIINMAQYRKYIYNLPTVHSPNDATSMIYSRIANNTSWSLLKIKYIFIFFLLRRYEKKNYYKFNKIIVTSNNDLKYLSELDNNISIESLPIVIDQEFILNKKYILVNNKIIDKVRIVCTGDLSNNGIKEGLLDFIIKSFPSILKIYPSTQLIILSRNYKEIEFNSFFCKSNIQVIEYVENYIEFIISSDIVLVPDKYGPDGIKTRTLHALALGMPVIGTRTGFSGIPVKDRKHGLIYDNCENCTILFIELIKSIKWQIELGENGHKLISEKFSINVLAPLYNNVYNTIGKKNSNLKLDLL